MLSFPARYQFSSANGHSVAYTRKRGRYVYVAVTRALCWYLTLLCLTFSCVVIAKSPPIDPLRLADARKALEQDKGANLLSSVSSEYPPFYSPDIAGNGLVYHLTEAAFRHAGYPLSHHFYPFARAKVIIKRGLADVLVGVWYRESREAWIAFSDPLLSVNILLYKRVGSQINYKSIEDLRQYHIGVGRGYANPIEFQDAQLQTEAVSTDIVNLRKLLAGRIDLVLISEDVANYLITKGGDEFKGKFEPIGEPLSVEQFHLGVSRKLANYQQILDNFNRSLREMHRSGEVQRLLIEYGFETNDYWKEKIILEAPLKSVSKH